MGENTELMRQIHPIFVQNDHVSSQAFRPTPKDECKLSVDNRDQIEPKDAWHRFTSGGECQSVGVQAVTFIECEEQELPVIEDGNPYPEHCSIDFSNFGSSQREKRAKILRDKAKQRGWLYKNDIQV